MLNKELGLHSKSNSEQFRDPNKFRRLCEELLADGVLDMLVRNTHDLAQIRNSYYSKLTRSHTGVPACEEHRLERSIWVKWRPYPHVEKNTGKKTCIIAGTKFLQVAPRIMTYQLPLFNSKKKQDWGYVDLVGISTENTPVVIELKDDDSAESPLRILLEAFAYGISIRKAWRSTPAGGGAGQLQQDWRTALAELGEDVKDIPCELHKCNLVCAAPPDYWARMRAGERLDHDGWSLFKQLISKVERFDFVVHFAKVQIEAETFLI